MAATHLGLQHVSEPQDAPSLSASLQNLQDICSGKAEDAAPGGALWPHTHFGQLDWQSQAPIAKFQEVFRYAMSWAGVGGEFRAGACDLSIAEAEGLHRQRLFCWHRFWTAAQAFAASADSSSSANGAAAAPPAAPPLRRQVLQQAEEKTLQYCLRLLEHIWALQKHGILLARILRHSGDYDVGSRVLLSQETKEFLRDQMAPDGDPDAAADSRANQRRAVDFEELVAHMLEEAAARNYRKRGETVYEEKKVSFGGTVWGTRAWEPAKLGSGRPETAASSIETFVYVTCSRERNVTMWRRVLALKGAGQVARYLQDCEDAQFPTLRPQRNLLAFRNGVLDTAAPPTGAFFPHHLVASHLPREAVACKYFDLEVKPEWFSYVARGRHDWERIETPFFQQILDYQRFGCKLESDDRRQQQLSNPSSCAEEGMAQAEEEDEVDKLAFRLENLCEEAAQLGADVAEELRQSPGVDAAELLGQAERGLESLLGNVQQLRAQAKAAADDRAQASATVGTAALPRPPPPSHVPQDGMPPEVQRWVYAFMGRMLHELGTFDAWQVIAFIKGRAGTGKSCIAHIVRNFFAAEDVGVLSNNIERKFGLMSLLDKFAFVCYELKRSLQLDQAEFQSIVSGEDLSVAVKNAQARTLRWKAPGLLCGNEGPGYMDAQGSIARRLVIVNFLHPIRDEDSDPQLSANLLQNEIAALIVKCNAAYRSLADEHGKKDIWSVLPPYFKEQRRKLQRDTDALYNTIWDDLAYDLACRDGVDAGSPEYDEYLLPMSVLEEDYKGRWRDIHGTMYPDSLNSDKWGQPFGEARLTVRREERTLDGVTRMDTWILGIRRRQRAEAAGAAPWASTQLPRDEDMSS